MADLPGTHGIQTVLRGAGTLDSQALREVEIRGRPGTAVLTRLFIYPVKSTRGIELDEAEIAATGLKWDRRWMIVDDKGRFLTQRERPQLARIVPEIRDALVLSAPGRAELRVPFDHRGPAVTVTVWRFTGEALEEAAEAHAWLSGFLGESVRLVKVSPQMGRVANPEYARHEPAPINFTDGYPFLVCNAASLSDLNERLPRAMPMECFRPNLVLEGLPPWAEDDIETVGFPGATLRLVKPCTRCAIPTRDFMTGEDSVNPTPVLRRFRWHKALKGVIFGENATLAAGGGALTVGSTCQITYRSPPRTTL
jgi:uncharacterized protein YcbX